MEEKLDKESFFIDQFIDSKHIGDDGAVIGKYVYSMDAFFENVHFRREWMSLRQIAHKAMLVNISDAIAMNAVPKYALLSVAIPKEFTEEQLKELGLGFNDIAKEYDMHIIGGDTISNVKLDISVTIVSYTNSPIYRTGLKKDELLCYTGELGTVKRDLEQLLDGNKIASESKFIRPQLKGDFFYKISSYVTSAMDISDGLFFECERLSKANDLGFEFLIDIPKNVGCSGEEYEMLFSIDQKDKNKVEAIAKEQNIKLNFFAKAVNGTFQSPCKAHHFK
jgi:thiamine-monophosphate kinase